MSQVLAAYFIYCCCMMQCRDYQSRGKSIEVFGIKFFLNGLKSFPKSLEMNNFSGTQEFDGIRNLRYIADYSENIVISRTGFFALQQDPRTDQ